MEGNTDSGTTTGVTAQTLYTVDQIKDKIKAKENVTGLIFVNARGAKGKIMGDLSVHGKRQAEMTCTIPDGDKECSETHIREQSDWHQSYACRTHKKTKAKAGAGVPAMGSIKLDNGTVVSYQRVLETDSPEVQAIKEQNNELYETVRAQKAEQAKADKEAKALARKQKLDEERHQRNLKLEEEKKEQLIANLERIVEYSQKNNMPISKKTLEQVEEYRAAKAAKAAAGQTATTTPN